MTEPKTLIGAHAYVAKLRPAPDAPLDDWVSFYRKSSSVYRAVAEIGRGHHHESLYWAGREARFERDVRQRLGAGKG
nr:AMED_5909 family protein [Amycolatopsis nigrescens]